MSELRKNQLLAVELTIRLPADASEDEVNDWLQFALLQSGSMPTTSPLYDHEPETFGPFGFEWKALNELGREERYDHKEHDDGSKTCKVRLRRERIA